MYWQMLLEIILAIQQTAEQAKPQKQLYWARKTINGSPRSEQPPWLVRQLNP